MRRFAPVWAGLLLALAIPLTASAHTITNVQIDCEGHVILVSGKLFASEATTVTVTGPGGYSESFFADQDAEWTVTLPLGPNGAYVIDWPGAAAPVDFSVDCPPATPTATVEATATAAATPTGGVEATATEAATPTGGVEAAVDVAAGPTAPPTDTVSSASGRSSSNTVALVLLGVAAAIVWITRTARDRSRTQAKNLR